MPDPHATITEAPPAVLEQIAKALEQRAADPLQRGIVERYLSDVQFPPAARVLEIGCGTGAIARILASWPNVGTVMGVDPASAFIAKARELGKGIGNLMFEEGDGRSLRFEAESFDVVVLNTVLGHIPNPETVLAEAHRVLRAGGTVAIADNDPEGFSVATANNDVLQECLEAIMTNVQNYWLSRRLPALVSAAGFEADLYRIHHLLPSDFAYALSLIDRGADLLASSRWIGAETATALKNEARRRVTAGEFFCCLGYVSIIGRKPTRTGD